MKASALRSSGRSMLNSIGNWGVAPGEISGIDGLKNKNGLMTKSQWNWFPKLLSEFERSYQLLWERWLKALESSDLEFGQMIDVKKQPHWIMYSFSLQWRETFEITTRLVLHCYSRRWIVSGCDDIGDIILRSWINLRQNAITKLLFQSEKEGEIMIPALKLFQSYWRLLYTLWENLIFDGFQAKARDVSSNGKNVLDRIFFGLLRIGCRTYPFKK